MHRSKVEVFIHYVWGTYQRLPLITAEVERGLYRNIEAEALKCRCTVRAIGGIADHVHILVKMPATITVAALAQQMKGLSSTFAREELFPGQFFGWCDGYSGFSVSPSAVDRVIAYIENQKQHHAEGTSYAPWEEIGEEVPER